MITWNDNKTITIDKPIRPKKITGTRFAAILGKNVWNTPFKTWCEITRTYEEPFKDSKYTIAGKTIEPIQHKYMRTMYGMSNLVTPEDIYGKDYFKKTYGDFYPKEKIFGGMWDALLVNEDKTVNAVLEFKTTSRPEDWEDDVPEYYAAQAMLYASLLNVERVIMVCSFLSDADYEHPEKYVPSVKNTIVREFNVHDRNPYFENDIKEAEDFWKEHVLTGISPEYSKRDEEIIKLLRTTQISNESSLTDMVNEAEALKEILDKNAAEIADVEKRYKQISVAIKNALMSELQPDTDTIFTNGNKYQWEVKRTVKADIDRDKLKADGLLEQYQINKEVLTLRAKEIK